MPADARRIESGRQFAADLRRIREAHGLSAAALHEETKIPRMLIDAFEASGLFEHPMFNRVYLRSFVRTYAGFVGVKEEDALEALEAALAGRYRGRLAQIYLGEPPPPPVDAPERSEEEGAEEGRAAAAGEALGAGSEEVEARGEAAEEGRVPAEADAPAEQRSAAALERRRRDRAFSRWLLLGLIALLLGGLLIVWLVRAGRPTPDDEVPPPEAADLAPAAAAVDTGLVEAPARAPVTVGEEIDVTIIAERADVRGLRLTRDDDLRRPFWIDQDSATVFPVEERIVIENPIPTRPPAFDNIRLLLEGYPFPTDRRDARNRIVITRSDAERFADTVRGEPFPLAAAPDTVRGIAF